jgi:hypothetical protein
METTGKPSHLIAFLNISALVGNVIKAHCGSNQPHQFTQHRSLNAFTAATKFIDQCAPTKSAKCNIACYSRHEIAFGKTIRRRTCITHSHSPLMENDYYYTSHEWRNLHPIHSSE